MDFAWMNYHYSRFPMSKFFNKVTETPFNKIELFLAAPHLNVFDYPLRKLLEMDREIQKRKLEII